MSTIYVDNLQPNLNNEIYIPRRVVQVVHGRLSSTYAATGAAGSDYWLLPGLQATITPKFSNSNILISVNIYAGNSNTSSGYQLQYQILKNGVELTEVNGTEESNRQGVAGRINNYSTDTTSLQYRMTMLTGEHMNYNVGVTSATTYAVRIRGYSSTPEVYINRQQNYQVSPSSSTDYDGVPQSTITLTEIST
jgi:hypothetical protein